MSNHRTKLTQIEEEGLRLHRLPIGKPSQLSDAFRQGVMWGLKNRPENLTIKPSEISIQLPLGL